MRDFSVIQRLEIVATSTHFGAMMHHPEHGLRKVKQLILTAAVSVLLGSSVGHAEDGRAPEFLRFGEPLSQQLSRLNEQELQRYKKAFASFPNVDDCLVEDKREPSWGSSRMRWKRLNTLEKVNWCVFLLASKISDHEQMLQWFNSNGFNAVLIERPPSVMRFYGYEGGGFIVSASVSIKQSPIPVGLVNWLIAHSITIGLTLTSDGEPRDVQTTYTRI